MKTLNEIFSNRKELISTCRNQNTKLTQFSRWVTARGHRRLARLRSRHLRPQRLGWCWGWNSWTCRGPEVYSASWNFFFDLLLPDWAGWDFPRPLECPDDYPPSIYRLLSNQVRTLSDTVWSRWVRYCLETWLEKIIRWITGNAYLRIQMWPTIWWEIHSMA